jgi:hypothetical protein
MEYEPYNQDQDPGDRRTYAWLTAATWLIVALGITSFASAIGSAIYGPSWELIFKVLLSVGVYAIVYLLALIYNS